MGDRAALPVRSDPTLVGDIRRYGTFDPAACYQCGSCTISCELVDDAASFPRRSLRYALLGLRAPLVSGIEPWICHDCGDCSLICPRQAEPRTSMMTLRGFLTAQYDWTGLSSRILISRAWHLGSLAAAAAITLSLIVLYHLFSVQLAFADFATASMGLEHTFPMMVTYTRVVMLVPLVMLLSHGGRMWWLTMREAHAPLSAYAAEGMAYVRASVAHTMLRKCPDRRRWVGHWLLAAGTVMMLAIKTFALRWFQTDNVYPIYHPQRWLGYVAAAFIVYGIATILIGRLQARAEFYRKTRLEDLIFPLLLLATALSGMGVHVFRYAGFALTSHAAFALHVVVATPMLVVEMSFGKWSHMMYRPLALYFKAVRARAGRQGVAEEALVRAA